MSDRTKSALKFLAVFSVLVLLVCICGPLFITHVGSGQIIVKDCDGAPTVWRSPRDDGFHLTDLCKIQTYHPVMDRRFQVTAMREEVRVSADGLKIHPVEYVIRGVLTVVAPEDDADMFRLPARYPSERALFDSILPQVTRIARERVVDSAWLRTGGGGWIARRFRDGFESRLQRLPQSEYLWSSVQGRRELETEINEVLRVDGDGVWLSIAVALDAVEVVPER